jgi:gluconolactonase
VTDSGYHIIAEGLGFTEGPVALPDGTLACTSITEGALFWIDAQGGVRRTETGGGPNGLAFDGHDAFFIAQNGGIFGGRPGATSGIQRLGPDGSIVYVVTDVDAPNDICFGPDGRLYFTDPRGEGFDYADPATAPAGRLYSCAADGSDLQLLTEGPAFINGLAFGIAADELYVVETSARRILRYPWYKGSLGQPEVAVQLTTGLPDGIAIDQEGAIWVGCTFDDAYVARFKPTGIETTRIQFENGAGTTNCCFGVRDPHHLYVTVSRRGSIARLRTEVPGLSLLRAA